MLLSCACFLAFPSAWPASAYNEIAKNMGGITFNGLPKLSFDFVDRADIGELSSLGFRFRLMHRVRLHHGRTARTEWEIPSLQTCAHIDAQGDVSWLTLTGRVVRFRKTEHGYAGMDDGVSVKVMQEDNVVEITTKAAFKWRYRGGYVESVSNWRGEYTFTTDRGTILTISKKTQNRTVMLLTCAYSKQGHLEGLEFGNGGKYRFQWADDNSLSAVKNQAGNLMEFEYADSLLSSWKRAYESRHGLRWQYFDHAREVARQQPPVYLCEDSRYTYKWTRGEGVRTVTIHDKNGVFVSETTIGATGLEQRTPKGRIKHGTKK
jgi:NOL1/NOP2/fmu family ribosome biogenesis protein